MQLKRVNFFLTQYLLHFNSPTPPSNLTPSNRPSSSFQQRRTFLVLSFNACSNVYFSWFNISCKTIPRQSHDLRATVVRKSHDVRENVVRRSMVINARNFIWRTSCECLVNVARMSRECRANVARMS